MEYDLCNECGEYEDGVEFDGICSVCNGIDGDDDGDDDHDDH